MAFVMVPWKDLWIRYQSGCVSKQRCVKGREAAMHDEGHNQQVT
jgi:hypothetical protein